MAFTVDDLNAIDEAIKKGERVVRFGDTEIEYNSFEDLKKRRSFIAGQLQAQASAGTYRTRTSYASFNRGL